MEFGASVPWNDESCSRLLQLLLLRSSAPSTAVNAAAAAVSGTKGDAVPSYRRASSAISGAVPSMTCIYPLCDISIYMCIFIYISWHVMYLCMYLYLSICLSICLSIYLFVHLSLHMCTYRRPHPCRLLHGSAGDIESYRRAVGPGRLQQQQQQ